MTVVRPEMIVRLDQLDPHSVKKFLTFCRSMMYTDPCFNYRHYVKGDYMKAGTNTFYTLAKTTLGVSEIPLPR